MHGIKSKGDMRMKKALAALLAATFLVGVVSSSFAAPDKTKKTTKAGAAKMASKKAAGKTVVKKTTAKKAVAKKTDKMAKPTKK
jgi:hypothetical protein